MTSFSTKIELDRFSAPVRQNVVVMRNDPIYWPLDFKDHETDEPIDITGWTFFFTIKNSLSDSDGDALIKKDWSLHEDAPGGITSLLVPAVSTNLTGQKWYDLQVMIPGNDPFTLVTGKITFDLDVTQRMEAV